jgi:serine/threonine protein kinase HipA of HipAB toxin-antitoxin module
MEGKGTAGHRLTLQVGLHAVNCWRTELENHAECYEMLSAETARKGSALELVYHVEMKSSSDALALLSQLNVLPGIESVSLKKTLN